MAVVARGGGLSITEIIDDIVEMITEAWTDADEATGDEEQGAGFFVEETELSYPSSGGVTKVRDSRLSSLPLYHRSLSTDREFALRCPSARPTIRCGWASRAPPRTRPAPSARRRVGATRPPRAPPRRPCCRPWALAAPPCPTTIEQRREEKSFFGGCVTFAAKEEKIQNLA